MNELNQVSDVLVAAEIDCYSVTVDGYEQEYSAANQQAAYHCANEAMEYGLDVVFEVKIKPLQFVWNEKEQTWIRKTE